MHSKTSRNLISLTCFFLLHTIIISGKRKIQNEETFLGMNICKYSRILTKRIQKILFKGAITLINNQSYRECFRFIFLFSCAFSSKLWIGKFAIYWTFSRYVLDSPSFYLSFFLPKTIFSQTTIWYNVVAGPRRNLSCIFMIEITSVMHT